MVYFLLNIIVIHLIGWWNDFSASQFRLMQRHWCFSSHPFFFYLVPLLFLQNDKTTVFDSHSISRWHLLKVLLTFPFFLSAFFFSRGPCFYSFPSFLQGKTNTASLSLAFSFSLSCSLFFSSLFTICALTFFFSFPHSLSLSFIKVCWCKRQQCTGNSRSDRNTNTEPMIPSHYYLTQQYLRLSTSKCLVQSPLSHVTRDLWTR